jgi:thiol:disulfide interchange protein DsbA
MRAIDRRNFLAALGGASALTLLNRPARAAAPVAGKDYENVDPPQPTTDPGLVVVTEYFSYMCPHCAAFAPTFTAWARMQPKDVKVERVAISLGHRPWEPAARAYPVLLAMNAVDKVEDALWASIHQQGAQLYTEAAIADWMGKHGVDAKSFSSQYKSFAVDMQQRTAESRARANRVGSTPTLVVDGRYRIQIGEAPVGREAHFRAQLAVVDQLIALARQQHKARG